MKILTSTLSILLLGASYALAQIPKPTAFEETARGCRVIFAAPKGDQLLFAETINGNEGLDETRIVWLSKARTSLVAARGTRAKVRVVDVLVVEGSVLFRKGRKSRPEIESTSGAAYRLRKTDWILPTSTGDSLPLTVPEQIKALAHKLKGPKETFEWTTLKHDVRKIIDSRSARELRLGYRVLDEEVVTRQTLFVEQKTTQIQEEAESQVVASSKRSFRKEKRRQKERWLTLIDMPNECDQCSGDTSWAPPIDGKKLPAVPKKVSLPLGFDAENKKWSGTWQLKLDSKSSRSATRRRRGVGAGGEKLVALVKRPIPTWAKSLGRAIRKGRSVPAEVWCR